MLRTNEEFHALIQQVLSGSEVAAQEFFRDYEPYLLHAIRQRLSKRIRSKFDSLDFAQDVWASFFAETPERRSFNNAADLITFLTKVAQNKITDAVRQRMMTEKNNVNREQSLDDSRHFDKHALAGREPTPSQILMSQEEWVEFLRKQPVVYRRIFILLRDGKTHDEIAQELDIDEKTVTRVVYRVIYGTAPREAS
jgi:RNA polymerase sigma factor (sigma-70 family)